MSNKKLRIIPLGGLGEVGKNMMLYEYGENIIIVDTGIMFPENDMLGIDYIIPDFNYLLDKRHLVRGVIITHGHEDHTGAIRHIMEEIDAPIYATQLTRGLLEVKLARGGLLDRKKLNTVEAGDQITIGPFTIEFFHVCHSIPDGVGLGITTPAGLIVHSGDYKFDHTPVDNWPTDYAKLGEFSGRGVLALLADSTNADKPGWTPSERVIDPAFDQVFSEAEGRIIIASFASLISRMQQVANAAQRHNRKLAFAGTSMVENAKMARKLGYLRIPEDLMVNIEQALNMNPAEIVLMSTGTQGEPSSILGRLSTGTNRHFDIIPGDTVVFSSHPIPGNEESIYRTINRLFRRGANVIYEPIAPVHVSGHASQEEMKLLLHLVKPKYFIPIHGEYRHLVKHAQLALDMGLPEENVLIAEDGDVICFDNHTIQVESSVHTGRTIVDGKGIGDVEDIVLRDRRKLSKHGVIIVLLAVDEQTGYAVYGPDIIPRGVVFEDQSVLSLEDTRSIVIDVLNELDRKYPIEWKNVESEIKKRLKRFLYNAIEKNPLILPIIIPV